jgi:hypothetical protein
VGRDFLPRQHFGRVSDAAHIYHGERELRDGLTMKNWVTFQKLVVMLGA